MYAINAVFAVHMCVCACVRVFRQHVSCICTLVRVLTVSHLCSDQRLRVCVCVWACGRVLCVCDMCVCVCVRS